jgi:S1-C subfamily serine protease
MRILFTLLLSIYSVVAFGQEYTTNYPDVAYSSCNYCRIAKVIVSEKNTKVLIEVTGQRGISPWVSFSKWTVLLPYNSGNGLSDLRKLDLNIPEIQSADPNYLSIWRDIADKRKSMQADAAKVFGESLIENLGSDELGAKYNIKSKEGEVFSFWMTFGKLPPGIEKVTIIELVEGGFEWSGIAITNPDNTPKSQWNEVSLKLDWEKSGVNPYEGIYENTIKGNNSSKYRVALKFNKTSDNYDLIYLSGASNTIWQAGDIKAIISKTASPNIFKAKWYLANKTLSEDLYISFEQGLIKIIWTDGSPEQLYLKLYPTASDNISSNSSNAKSSGTGYAISSNGYIVTNHHVTNGATSIKIRGVNGDFSKTYTAKVIIEDKNNDLAIIKIEDPNFTTLGTIPYVIANRASDVGSSVFVLGYPLRATMGDEVKLTNGIISSKSGFQGDVTSYQITAPVQPGNSGGPLFDDKGSIIGIINAKHIGAENAAYAIKASYLMNLIDLMPTPPKLQTISTVAGKTLTEQVKILKKFTYIIEINR